MAKLTKRNDELLKNAGGSKSQQVAAEQMAVENAAVKVSNDELKKELLAVKKKLSDETKVVI
jgi:hypothetical protein